MIATAPPPTDLAFIDFDAQAPSADIIAVPPHLALIRLLPNCYRLDRHAAGVLPTLARLVATARTWEIRTPDGAEAVEQLLATIADTPQANRIVETHTASDPQRPTHGPMPAPGSTFANFVESGAVV